MLAWVGYRAVASTTDAGRLLQLRALLKGGYVSGVLKDLIRRKWGDTTTVVVGVDEEEKDSGGGGGGAASAGVGTVADTGVGAAIGGRLNEGSDDDKAQQLQQQRATRRGPFETANTPLLRHISAWVERKVFSIRAQLKLNNNSYGTTKSSSLPDEVAVAAAAAARRRWALFLLLMVLTFFPVKRWRTFYASK